MRCYNEIPSTSYVDSDWVGDRSHRRSVICYIMNLAWYCKTQSMVETIIYSAEFIAMKPVVEHLKKLSQALRAFSVHFTKLTDIRCDKKVWFFNTMIC